MPPFSKGSEGILPAVFWQVFKNRDLEGLLEKLRLQCLEPCGHVEPAPLRERGNGWPCLSFPFWKMTQSQFCCLEIHHGQLLLLPPVREAGTWGSLPCLRGSMALYGSQLRGNKRGRHPQRNSSLEKGWEGHVAVTLQPLRSLLCTSAACPTHLDS